MAMTDKIRAEIERRKKYQLEQFNKKKPDGRPNDCWTESLAIMGELEELLSFLDTIEEQECPEYCVRSHCIGCSKYNPDEWSNKPRKARVKATGEIVEGFTDGQGHFDVFTDHNICNRYDVSVVEFDPFEEPVSEDLEEEISTWIPAHISGGDDEVWRDTKNAVTEWAGIVARHFAEWQKAKMLKDNPVIMSVEDFQALIDSHAKRVEADYKEKMLKEAVRGEVYKFGKVAYVKERNNTELTKYLSQFNNGDKVKIIVVHETDIRQ